MIISDHQSSLLKFCLIKNCIMVVKNTTSVIKHVGEVKGSAVHMDDSLSKICLFVRNLPYSLTDAELETIFKPYGAIKSCFIVKDKGRFGFLWTLAAVSPLNSHTQDQRRSQEDFLTLHMLTGMHNS